MRSWVLWVLALSRVVKSLDSSSISKDAMSLDLEVVGGSPRHQHESGALQLHTFRGAACAAIRGSRGSEQRVVAEECDPASETQRFVYDEASRAFSHVATGLCIQGGTLEGEKVRAVGCQNQTELWSAFPRTGGMITMATTGLCLSYDMGDNLKECDRDCATDVFDIVLARSCVRQCLGGSALQERPLYTAKCSGRDDQYWKLESLQPVDCVLSSWKTVKPCSASCNGGLETRKRTPKIEGRNGGELCRIPTQIWPCNTQHCPPVSCKMGPWQSWSSCSKECGGGVMRRQREVAVQPENGGNGCGQDTDERPCNSHSCEAGLKPCKVSPWSPWSACSTYCGGGSSKRTRKVLNQKETTDNCPHIEESEPCSEEPCHEDCILSAWTHWGTCSGKCGARQQSRSREIVVLGRNGGRPCSQPLVEVKSCGEQECTEPIDCVMSPWSRWSKCSAECGGGWQSSTRYVETFQRNEGKMCPVDLHRSQECNIAACPDSTAAQLEATNATRLANLQRKRTIFAKAKAIAHAKRLEDLRARSKPVDDAAVVASRSERNYKVAAAKLKELEHRAETVSTRASSISSQEDDAPVLDVNVRHPIKEE